MLRLQLHIGCTQTKQKTHVMYINAICFGPCDGSWNEPQYWPIQAKPQLSLGMIGHDEVMFKGRPLSNKISKQHWATTLAIKAVYSNVWKKITYKKKTCNGAHDRK